MKFIKVAFIIILMVVAILGSIVFFGLKNLDALVKSLIESEGSALTRTEVSLEAVNIHLREGKGELRGFSLDNPIGFSASPAMQTERIFLDIDPLSLTEDVIAIEQVAIEGLHILVEQQELSTNLLTLLSSIQKSSPTAAKSSQTPTESDTRLMIERVKFVRGNVTLKTEEYGEYKISLPNLQLKDIGDRQKGLSPDELGRALLEPIIHQAKDAAKDRLEDLAKEKVKDKAKDKLKEKLQDKLSDKDVEKLESLKSLLKK